MSIVEQEQKEVLEQNNTGQSQLLAILDTLNSNHAIELRFDNPMNGQLDFSVLRARHFNKVSKIVFSAPGKVTSISNIPDGIDVLECPNQLLTEFTDKANDLVELDLTGNHLMEFSGLHLPKLRVLRLSDNELGQITHLTRGLEVLECENNQLRQLNLTDTTILNTLHCSNNPLLAIQNLPDTLTDYSNENNPFVEADIREGAVEGSDEYKDNRPGNEKGKKSSRADKRIDYLESIHNYLKLKHEYETKLHSLRKTAYEKSLVKGKGLVKQMMNIKPPCVSCKRKVGTIFKIHKGRYTAVCGDKTKPCNLNIQIFNGDYFNLDNLLNIYSNEIRVVKEKIIVQKLDTLFNYVGENAVVEKFKAELQEYNGTYQMYQDTLKRYHELYSSPVRREQIVKKTQVIYRIREDIERMMGEYNKTNNPEILSEAMTMQIKELTPAIHNLRLLKYDTMMVETNIQEPPIATLVQREVAVNKQDFIFGEEPRVIKYVIQ